MVCVSLLILAPAPSLAQPPGGGGGGGSPTDQLVEDVDTLKAQVQVLEALLADVTRNGNTLVFGATSGLNIQVVSGAGATDAAPNGNGNLIIGYDEAYTSAFETCEEAHGVGNCSKTGSHNLIVGPGHSYPSTGGIVGGSHNGIVATSASVLGGSHNAASGLASVITAGFGNDTPGLLATVSGGSFNTAGVRDGDPLPEGGGNCVEPRPANGCGSQSSISGGVLNKTSGIQASVTGGILNVAAGNNASVTGGSQNVAAGPKATVGGGRFNNATHEDSTIGGGSGGPPTTGTNSFPDTHLP